MAVQVACGGGVVWHARLGGVMMRRGTQHANVAGLPAMCMHALGCFAAARDVNLCADPRPFLCICMSMLVRCPGETSRGCEQFKHTFA
jgi:hypothetical protein